MKMKTKIVVLVEIAIVLCSVFLVVLPTIAAQEHQEMQKASASITTTASKDDFVLDIYGNANEDDTIDMGDVVYTKLAIFGKKPKTKLCDAKYDGRINVLDVIQTKLIILGKEKELTLIDEADRVVTVKKPIERIVCTSTLHLVALRTLESKDAIVGVPTPLDTGFFPELSDLPCIGTGWTPDIEAILELHPDVVLLIVSDKLDGVQNVLEAAGVGVLRFNVNQPENLPKGIEKLGYALGKREEAKEYVDWHENILNSIEENVGSIPEEDKPKVYSEYSPYKVAKADDILIVMAGGKDIFIGTSGLVEAEAVISEDPDIIIRLAKSDEGGYGFDADDTARLAEVRRDIVSRSELQTVTAIKEEHVYVIIPQLWTFGMGGGCSSLIGVCYLAKWFHPELLPDLDPKAINQEYLTEFQELDIDLDEKGVFVYPPLE